MDILLITIPPLIMFIFFNRQIVAGMTSRRRQGLTAAATPQCRLPTDAA